jgi:hypothetical protein
MSIDGIWGLFGWLEGSFFVNMRGFIPVEKSGRDDVTGVVGGLGGLLGASVGDGTGVPAHVCCCTPLITLWRSGSKMIDMGYPLLLIMFSGIMLSGL